MYTRLATHYFTMSNVNFNKISGSKYTNSVTFPCAHEPRVCHGINISTTSQCSVHTESQTQMYTANYQSELHCLQIETDCKFNKLEIEYNVVFLSSCMKCSSVLYCLVYLVIPGQSKATVLDDQISFVVVHYITGSWLRRNVPCLNTV